MVALDDGARSLVGHGLDDVGIQGALSEELDVVTGVLDGLGFLVEDVDEGVADDLALLFRIVHAGQQVEEQIGGLNVLEVQIEVFAQVSHDLFAFVLTQHAVVHEDAVELLTDGLVEQHGHHGGIHAAGERADDVAVAHGFAHLLHHAFHEGAHGPVGRDLRHLEEEVADHLRAVFGVMHFGVELQGVDAAFVAAHGGHVEGGGAAGHDEAGRRRLHLVAVGHPHAGAFAFGEGGNAVPQGAVGHLFKVGGAVFAGFGLGEHAAELVGEKLHAVADAEHRHAEFKQALVEAGSVLFAHAGGAAGKNDGVGMHGGHGLGGGDAGMNFGIDSGLAHAAGDELGDLGAEVENDDFGHAISRDVEALLRG